MFPFSSQHSYSGTYLTDWYSTDARSGFSTSRSSRRHGSGTRSVRGPRRLSATIIKAN
jgi:hypothetical protein